MIRPLQTQEGRLEISSSNRQSRRPVPVLMQPQSWFVTFDPRPQAGRRLYCAPYAGGNASAYRDWARALPGDIELRAIQLPGRQNRLHEVPYTSAIPLARDLASVLSKDLADLGDGGAYALFGHSLGAVVAFETARALRLRQAPQPALLALSGRSAPQAAEWTGITTRQLSDPAFLAWVRHFGGLPDAVSLDPEFLRLILPTLRADFAIAETHRLGRPSPLALPISVLAGETDPTVTLNGLHAWSKLTTSACTVRTFPGSHFYLHQAGPAVLDAIVQDLRGAAPHAS